MIQISFFLILGIALLIYGARFLVDGASSLARRTGISALAVGLTIVAFGTSAPELVVNLVASVQGKADIAIGNVVGGNFVNLLFILGLAAVIFPLKVQRSTVWKEIPFSVLAVLAVAVLANDALVDRLGFSALTRSDGVVLLFFFIIFLYYTYGISKATGDAPTADIKPISIWRCVCMVAGGLLMLVTGGHLTVSNAVEIARAMGVSEALIGLTIVAVGTSLPELATSAMAAWKRQADLAVGNVIGSNIFNIFLILGVSALIRPIPFAPAFNLDLLALIAGTLLTFFALFVGRRHVLERWQGATLVSIYFVYLAFIIVRG